MKTINLNEKPECYGSYSLKYNSCITCNDNDSCENFKIEGLNKHNMKKMFNDNEYNLLRLSNKDLAQILRFTLHPHTLEKLSISVLTAIADFNGYYPLQTNKIAENFKGEKL